MTIKNLKILVVDDEEDILELIEYNLTLQGYHVFTATSGEDAIKVTQSEPVHLIILDLMLPGIDGLEVARRLKSNPKTTHIPIMMLTAKGEESDVVLGLEIGADDYIIKPFSLRILLARVHAMIRRKARTGLPEDDVVRIHALEIFPKRRSVQADNKSVDLTFTEFQVLHFLAAHPGWVYTRSQIVDNIRGDNYPVTDRSVDVQIVGLRKKLGVLGKYIETVRGVGYRFSEEP